MIGLSHKDNKENIICLVDSGADNNLFPADFGRRIGLKIEDGKPGSTAGITDEKMVTYKHKVKLWVNEKSFYVPVDFCDGFNHATPLLGQKGFFDLFNKVVFKKEEKIFELH